MKKVLAILLAAVLLFSLASCSCSKKDTNPSSEPEKTSEADTEKESEAEEEDTEAAPEEDVTAEPESEDEETEEASESEEAETEEASESEEAETEEASESEESEAEGDEDTDKADVMTYDDYINADLDSEVTVDVYVQAHQDWWDNKITVYAADQDGAYFIYEMACSEDEAAQLEPGTLIRVHGFKSEWSGEVEITDAEFELATGAKPYVAEALDVTDLLGTDELAEKMNAYVSFKGMTIAPSEDADGNEAAFLYNWDGSGTPGNDLYFNAKKGGDVYTFTVESYLCGQDTDVYKAVESLEIGQVVDMEGFLYWYNGPNPHITVIGEAEESEEGKNAEEAEPSEDAEKSDDADDAEGDAEAEAEETEAEDAEAEDTEAEDAEGDAEAEDAEASEDDAEIVGSEDLVDYYTKSEGVMTYAEYMDAELDTEVTVEVFVQDHQSWWEDKVSVYAADPDGGYFIYNMACSEEDAEKLETGTKIKVTGYKSEWSGEVEIADATFEFCEEGSGYTPLYSDVTALLGTDALDLYMNQLVHFSALTVAPSEDADGNEAPFLYNWDGSGERGNDLYFNVEYSGNVYTFTVESYLCDEETDVYKAVEELQIGDVIDLYGYLYWYNGPNPHIIMVSPSEGGSNQKSEGVMNWFEYRDAELDTEVTIEAYVMDTQSWWEDKITVYAADADGAYFIYELACPEEDADKLQPGAKIRVNGYKTEWSGEVEIADATFELLDDAESFFPQVTEVSRLLDNEALSLFMNRCVFFNNMTITASKDADGNEVPFLYNWDGSGERGNDIYFNAEFNGKEYTFTIESYLRDQDSKVYQDAESLQIGDVVQLQGYLYWYNGPNPHITEVDVIRPAE